jgi:menaquinone-9 beta-reductase
LLIYDLIVIGGGPAGTSAAITAVRSGARVLLLERGRFPRHKVCGEFVSPESLALLRDLLQSSDLLDHALRITQARFFIDHHILHAPIEPAAESIARLNLDFALWDSAHQAGVEAKPQTTVQHITGDGPFTVTTSIGHYETRAVVNASGRWSKLNVSLPATGNGEGKWIGLKAHFSEPATPASVDLYFFDGGYCGVQPVCLDEDRGRSRINACAMVRADVASSVSEVVELHPALRARAVHWQQLMNPISVSPLVFGTPRPAWNSILLVGDAAGFIDPFVGDGISLALRSGALAAQCLIRFFAGEISLPQAISQYADQYQRQFASVFRSSSSIRRMLRLPRPVRTPILSFLARRTSVAEYLVRKTR